MTNLPADWDWVELGDLGKWYGGGTPSKRQPRFWQDGTIPWLSPKDMGPDTLIGTRDKIAASALDESPVRLVPEGSVTVVVRSGILSRTMPVAFVPFATALNQDMKAVAPYAGINSHWIAWGLRAFERQILRDARKSGTTVASLEMSRLMRFRLPIPPSAEQARIVTAVEGYIGRLDAKIVSLRSILDRASSFQEQIIPTWTTGLSEKAHEGLSAADVDDGALPILLPGWKWKRLGEVAAVVGGITKDSKTQGDPTFVEVPYLRVANVQRGSLDLTDISTIRVSRLKAEKLRLRPGDVLLNEGGDRDKLGRGWVWEGQIDNCIHQNHVFRARIHDGMVHPKIIAWHANGFGKVWCERNGKQTTNLASISLSRIKLLPVPVPPEESDQESLVREVEVRFDMVQRGMSAIKLALSQGAALRSEILRLAFSGRLLPQDSVDELA